MTNLSRTKCRAETALCHASCGIREKKQETSGRRNEMRYYFLEMALWRGSREILFFRKKEIGRGIKEEKSLLNFQLSAKRIIKIT
jgi:hypothetical protein